MLALTCARVKPALGGFARFVSTHVRRGRFVKPFARAVARSPRRRARFARAQPRLLALTATSSSDICGMRTARDSACGGKAGAVSPRGASAGPADVNGATTAIDRVRAPNTQGGARCLAPTGTENAGTPRRSGPNDHPRAAMTRLPLPAAADVRRRYLAPPMKRAIGMCVAYVAFAFALF